MTYEQAMTLVGKGNEARHPNMIKGYIIFSDDGNLVSYNPFTADKADYQPTEDDTTRTDWIAGRGLASL